MTHCTSMIRMGLFMLTGLLCQPSLAGEAGKATSSSSSAHLTAGMRYVAAPYQAGAKFRTPEGLEHALAEDVAQGLGVALTPRSVDDTKAMTLLSTREVRMIVTEIRESDPRLREKHIVPTPYSAGPMAIMRTDTTIKTWDQLKGRTVCLSEGSPYKGMTAKRYGAIEQIYPAPADSLLALRIGKCDAAVHDSTFLEQLLQLPEWKKFSARLPVGERSVLAFVTHRNDTELAAQLTRINHQWKNTGHLAKLNEKRVKHVAFEVYLDQNVPDCH